MNISFNFSASTIAWYGAIVSTVALIISAISALIHYLSYRWDRPRIRLGCKDGMRVAGQAFDTIPYKKDTDYICITVMNVGKRPVTIGKVGFIAKNKKKSKNAILTDSFIKGSREIKEGQASDYMLEEATVDKSNIKFFVAYDLTGRCWKGKLERNKS